MHEARPSIATEMPADNFYYQARPSIMPQHQEQPGYDEHETHSNPGYHQHVQGQTPMSAGLPRIPHSQGRQDARTAYGHEEKMSQQKRGYAVD